MPKSAEKNLHQKVMKAITDAVNWNEDYSAYLCRPSPNVMRTDLLFSVDEDVRSGVTAGSVSVEFDATSQTARAIIDVVVKRRTRYILEVQGPCTIKMNRLSS